MEELDSFQKESVWYVITLGGDVILLYSALFIYSSSIGTSLESRIAVTCSLPPVISVWSIQTASSLGQGVSLVMHWPKWVSALAGVTTVQAADSDRNAQLPSLGC